MESQLVLMDLPNVVVARTSRVKLAGSKRNLLIRTGAQLPPAHQVERKSSASFESGMMPGGKAITVKLIVFETISDIEVLSSAMRKVPMATLKASLLGGIGMIEDWAKRVAGTSW